MLPPLRAIGTVDGANIVFRAPSSYKEGTLAVWVNGQLIAPEAENGFVEAGGDVFFMKEPPLHGSVIMVSYWPI